MIPNFGISWWISRNYLFGILVGVPLNLWVTFRITNILRVLKNLTSNKEYFSINLDFLNIFCLQNFVVSLTYNFYIF